MNDAELNEALKRATVPERTPEYWERFPGRVMAELRRRPQTAPADANLITRHGRAWTDVIRLLLSRPAPAASAIVVLLGLTFFVGYWRGQHSPVVDPQFATAQKYFKEIEALFPNQIQAIVFDQRGTQLVLAQEPNVPKSPPLYLKICGPRGCQSFVTFSGQQIRVNGDVCDVLADGRGEVLVIGRQLLWSGGKAIAASGGYQVEARALQNRL
jgi:hypothetical protein